MSHQSALISQDIESYLHKQENKELLRFLTCGSVDDGKSTLIGRLLHDTKMIYEDQLAAIKQVNSKVGNAGDDLDLALLVDGLQAEREQGITIDVAYRYFSTEKRKFIIADTPGHTQYTRNMATGASHCNLAIILIDARYGVQEQTKRHSFITSKLGIAHTVIAINKMDLVDYDEARYEEIKAEYLDFSKNLNQPNAQFIPMSALKGDNIVNASEHMPWYHGAPLLDSLENVELDNDHNFETLRFPVQYVNRPNLDFRGYCGTLTSGVVKVGDEVTVLPSRKTSKVASIVTYDGELQEAYPPMSITLTLEDEIDVSRGDIITHNTESITLTDRIQATLVWMNETPLNIGATYDIKLLAGRIAGSVTNIKHKIDVNTLAHLAGHKLNLNETALCEIKLEQAIIADDYRQLPATGSFIIIDRLTNATVAAGMIEHFNTKEDEGSKAGIVDQPQISAEEKAQRFGQKPALITFKAKGRKQLNQLIYTLEKRLAYKGRAVATIDRSELPPTQATQLLLDNGLIVLCEHFDELNSDHCFTIYEETIDTDSIDKLITTLQEKDLI